MYQFAGQAKVFNGRYWRTLEVREKASTLQAATAAGVRHAIAEAKKKYKVRSIQAVNITIERLGPVVTQPEEIEDRERHAHGCVCADCSGAELTATNE